METISPSTSRQPGINCRYCTLPRSSATALTCGRAGCLSKRRREMYPPTLKPYMSTRPPAKPVVYSRVCNRCDLQYTGTGRLLCGKCWAYVNQAGL